MRTISNSAQSTFLSCDKMIKQIDAKTIQAMREMRRLKYAYATIAARFNVHPTTVRRYTKHISVSRIQK